MTRGKILKKAEGKPKFGEIDGGRDVRRRSRGARRKSAPIIKVKLHLQFVPGFGHRGGGMLQHFLLFGIEL